MSWTQILWTVTGIDVLVIAFLIWLVSKKAKSGREWTPEEAEQYEALKRMNDRDER